MDDDMGFEFSDPYDSMPFGDLMRLRDRELDEDEAAGEYDIQVEDSVVGMTYSEALAQVLAIFPHATFGDDNDGQLIIYTDMVLRGDSVLPFGIDSTEDDDESE